MIADPNTRPETVAFLVEKLDREHRPVAKTPPDCIAPKEIVDCGAGQEMELTPAQEFAAKYKLGVQ